MSVIPSLSWQTAGTPDYISRKEVIDLLEDLSGVDLSGGSLFYRPNALFSTIQINPIGNITGGNNYDALTSLTFSTTQLIQTQPYVGTSYIPSIQQIGGSIWQPLGMGQAVIKPGSISGNFYTGISPTTASIYNTTNQAAQIWAINTNQLQLGLTNISSINGQAPNTAGTTFTTLTGTTLNATNVNTTNLAGVSQFNGLPKVAPYRSTFNITGISGYSDNTPTIIGTITPGITIPANSLCAVSVPIKFGGFASGSPAVVYFNLGLRVGGAGAGGGIFYTTPVAINTNLTSGSSSVLISGIFPTPTASATNTIEIILISQQGVSVTCPFSNPVSPANVYSISVLS